MIAAGLVGVESPEGHSARRGYGEILAVEEKFNLVGFYVAP
jgi:hypothetical protein